MVESQSVLVKSHLDLVGHWLDLNWIEWTRNGSVLKLDNRDSIKMKERGDEKRGGPLVSNIYLLQAGKENLS